MNKKELSQKIASRYNLNIQNATDIVTDVFKTIMDHLSKEEDVSIVGFGKFKVRNRTARMGRNPNTGEKMTISATRTPIFQAGKVLTQRVKKGRT